MQQSCRILMLAFSTIGVIFFSPSKAHEMTAAELMAHSKKVEIVWKGQINPTVPIRAQRFDARAQGRTVIVECAFSCADVLPNLTRNLTGLQVLSNSCDDFVFAKIEITKPDGSLAIGTISHDGTCFTFGGRSYILPEEFVRILQNSPVRLW